MSLIDEIQIDLDREDYFHPDSKISRLFSPRFKDLSLKIGLKIILSKIFYLLPTEKLVSSFAEVAYHLYGR